MIDSIAKCSMIGLMAFAAPVQSVDPSLWAQWGLAGVVVAYVLWRDHHRERRMAASIDAQQHWIRDTLVAALERNAQAINRLLDRGQMDSWDRRIQADQPNSRERSEHAHHS